MLAWSSTQLLLHDLLDVVAQKSSENQSINIITTEIIVSRGRTGN
jgi:hypothetical protein